MVLLGLIAGSLILLVDREYRLQVWHSSPIYDLRSTIYELPVIGLCGSIGT